MLADELLAVMILMRMKLKDGGEIGIFMVANYSRI